MDEREFQIRDMQAWVFVSAQIKWNKTPKDCTLLFAKYNLLGYIEECYELLHTSSYNCALEDIEDILNANGINITASNSTIRLERKTSCAIHLMRNMLIKYSDKHNISFENAMLEFTKSNTYEALFDYSDAIWKEGPDYLLDLYEEELNGYK